MGKALLPGFHLNLVRMKICLFSILTASIFFFACHGSSDSSGAGQEIADSIKPGLQQTKAMDSSALKKNAAFSILLPAGKISFHVYSPNNPLHNSIIIQPVGIKDSSLIQTGVLGRVDEAFTADLNEDGYPEVYYTTLLESGERNLFGYGSNKNLSLTPVYIPDMGEDKKYGNGYRGHDEYKISGHRLVRSFPVYTSSDPGTTSSGNIRIVNYKLVPGVNGWILKITDSKDESR